MSDKSGIKELEHNSSVSSERFSTSLVLTVGRGVTSLPPYRNRRPRRWISRYHFLFALSFFSTSKTGETQGRIRWRGPIYSLGSQFPPYAHMESNQVPWKLLLPEVWHPGLQLVQEKLRISQMKQKSYALVPFSQIYVTFIWSYQQ